ncbi:hypothetical protein LXA43DRAFT_1065562 [Ganoderma leucocontextum]|nr:hypothetical protein LXA43DRAFT_1065562 [Ganoderma leucocontextum]
MQKKQTVHGPGISLLENCKVAHRPYVQAPASSKAGGSLTRGQVAPALSQIGGPSMRGRGAVSLALSKAHPSSIIPKEYSEKLQDILQEIEKMSECVRKIRSKVMPMEDTNTTIMDMLDLINQVNEEIGHIKYDIEVVDREVRELSERRWTTNFLTALAQL